VIPLKRAVLFAPAVALSLAACGSSQPLAGSGVGAKVDTARFLSQATFGATMEDIDALSASRDYSAWLDQQRAAPISLELPDLQAQNKAISEPDRLEVWWRFAVTGPDQLRQRMAFALSEIMVISDQSALSPHADGMAYYYDLLAKNALGNFRDLLEDVTLSPEMGHFLSMWHNQKPSPDYGIRSDENYAREVMQLFTIGLVQLNLDGTPKLDGNGNAIPTFSQSDVANLARMFTGWSWGGGTSDADFDNVDGDWARQMEPYEIHHDENAKVILDNTPVPAGLQARPELKIALDKLFNHPNVGPFIAKQLIQRLTLSNPSPAYVARVAQAFNDNGHGSRGDLYAMARAILLDPEARAAPAPHGGKLREPVLRPSHIWRAFHAKADNGRYDYQQAASAFAESPLSAPSVFNFFRPDFRPLGVISGASLVAPEFGITDESTIINGANELYRVSLRYTGSQGRTPGASADDILLDFTPWEARAAKPDQLVDDLGLVLMSGLMPSTMRQTLIDYVKTVPEDQTDKRVSELVYLILTSPQYAAQN
jgi:uncharacterized protein (DUF1800 family)